MVQGAAERERERELKTRGMDHVLCVSLAKDKRSNKLPEGRAKDRV